MTQQRSFLARAVTAVLAGLFAITLATLASAASEFEGVWKVKGTKGKPFEITLTADGSAKATLPKEGMTGTWKEEGGAAVISWKTGWTTKISKQGDKYKKTAWRKGKPLSGPPTNSSDAQKVK